MSLILKMLFLCAILPLSSHVSADSMYIPVEIEGGGTVKIESQNDCDPNCSEIHLADGEKGRAVFRFAEEGIWMYQLYQPDAGRLKADPAVYILKVVTSQEGKIEEVLLFEKGSDEKTAAAVWHNPSLHLSPDTSDSPVVRIYAMTSFISLLLAAVLFRIGGEEDDDD